MPAALVDVVPQGALQRGSVVACTGHGSMSLAMSLAGAAASESAWVGVAGLPTFGARAADELGISLARLVLVIEPAERFSAQQWGDILAALIDGFDLVVLGGAAAAVRAGTARTLQARAQSRGAVLVLVGHSGSFSADLQLAGTTSRWDGLGDGHGVATARRMEVEVHGRRVPRPRRTEVWLPSTAGALEPVETSPVLELPTDLRRAV